MCFICFCKKMGLLCVMERDLYVFCLMCYAKLQNRFFLILYLFVLRFFCFEFIIFIQVLKFGNFRPEMKMLSMKCRLSFVKCFDFQRICTNEPFKSIHQAYYQFYSAVYFIYKQIRFELIRIFFVTEPHSNERKKICKL